MTSVRLRPQRFVRGDSPAPEAGGRSLGRPELLVGNAADGGLRLLLHGGLACGVAAPSGVDEGAVTRHDLAKAVVGDGGANAVCLTPVERRREHVPLPA